MEISRRTLCSLLPVLFSNLAIAGDLALPSAVFPFDEMQAKPTKAGEVRNIVKGATRTGEQIEVHETTLSPGASPHPPHKHAHSEFWLIREGTVEITINGQPHKIGPGSVAFASSNDEHGIRNVGTVPAQYFVVAIGPMS